MLKEFVISTFIGIFTAMIGCVVAVFVAEMFVAGLIIYMIIIIIICTRMILKKLDESTLRR